MWSPKRWYRDIYAKEWDLCTVYVTMNVVRKCFKLSLMVTSWWIVKWVVIPFKWKCCPLNSPMGIISTIISSKYDNTMLSDEHCSAVFESSGNTNAQSRNCMVSWDAMMIINGRRLRSMNTFRWSMYPMIAHCNRLNASDTSQLQHMIYCLNWILSV